eukprot:2998837-Rhodomonas_salina.2
MSGTAPNDALEKQHHQSRRGFQQRRVQTNRVQTNSNRPGSAQLEEKQRSLWDNFLCLDIKRKEPMQTTTWAERSLSDRVCDCDFDFQWSEPPLRIGPDEELELTISAPQVRRSGSTVHEDRGGTR